MRLNGLTIQGFKSFPDRTDIRFGSGITAIVGPNGSGKSNIVDAMRWVMGEQSTKTLRGSKMEEVIFLGTTERKPVSFAEVTLSIDNSDGALPMEYSEVTVTRRLYRSGESEYYINKSAVRLKDVHELFMNTGLGRDGYSVIGQGKIADVLSSRSEDRRQIFEEAVGISKYRYRKVEAERKLAHTDENLVRIRDILGELESRVEPLREQSEKARLFLDLREERKHLEINVWLTSMDKLKETKERVESDCEAARAELEKASGDVDGLNKLIDDTFAQIQEINAGIDEDSGKIRELEEQVAALQSAAAVAENNITHLNERIRRASESIEQSEQRLRQFDERIAAKNAAIAQSGEEIARQGRLLEECMGMVSTADGELTQAQGEIDRIRGDMARLEGEAGDLRVQLSTVASDIKNGRDGAAALRQAIAERRGKIDELEQKKREGQGILEDIEALIMQNGNIINGLNKKGAIREAKRAELAETKGGIERRLSAKQQSVKMLEDMTRHLEGFSGSVKTVMREAGRGRLKNIYGPLGSLVTADAKYAVALEIAMGAAVNNIVVRNDDDAKAAIALLKAEKAGRATFLPLSVIKPQTLSEQGVEAQPGYIGIAAELIQYEDIFGGVVKNILGRVVVVDNIDNGIRMARQYGNRLRIVTLDGQLLNPGGSITGGSVSKSVGMLSRANEIAAIKADIEGLEASLEEIGGEMRETETALAAIKAQVTGAEAERSTAMERRVQTESGINACDTMIESLRDDIASDEQRILDAQDSAGVLALRERELSQRADDVRKKQAEAEKLLAEKLGSGEEASKRRDELREQVNGMKLRLAELESDARAHKDALEDILEQKSAHLKDTAAREDEIEQLRWDIESLRESEKRDLARQEQLKQDIGAVRRGMEEQAAKRDELQQKQTQARQEEKSRNSEKERLIKEQTRLEARRAAVQNEYDGLIAKLWDEYEITFTEAQAQRVALESPAKAARRINEIKLAMKDLGDVNIGAIEEYKVVRQRYEFYTEQVNDLEASRAEILRMVEELTEQMRLIFAEQFVVINERFGEVFRELFGGGKAKLILSDPDDVLSSGIDISVAPPGKIIKNLTALSGGEQAFVAIALYFSIMMVRPTPFCILDEVETALDDVNVTRFATFLRRFTDNTQLILITHRRGTMEEADILYGVTMQEQGVSKLLAINVAELERKLKITG